MSYAVSIFSPHCPSDLQVPATVVSGGLGTVLCPNTRDLNTSNTSSVTTSGPAGSPVTTSGPAGSSVTTSGPAGSPVTTSGPTGSPVTTSGPAGSAALDPSQTVKEDQDASVEDPIPIPTVLVGHANKNKEPEEEIFSRGGIFMSLLVVFCVLFLAGLVVAFILQRKFRWIKSSYKPRKYKFVGSFFPSRDTGAYIPPTGTPKVPGAEQSRLLDSDEEEV